MSSVTPSPPPRRRLLVVEDDPVLRRIHEEALGRAGYDVLLASDGESGWARYLDDRPDLVVTELLLPKTPGHVLCRRIQAQADPPPVPVVLLSVGNKEVHGDSDALLRFGADAYLEKPVSTDLLKFRIRELLAGRPSGLVDGSLQPRPTRPAWLLDPRIPFHQGELAERDVASLFAAFLIQRQGGKLVVMQGGQVRQVWFRRGNPVFAESNVAGEELGEWLLARRKVRADALEAARAEYEEVERHLGVVLVSRGDLGASELFRSMRGNVEQVLLGLFSWEEGQFYLEFADGLDAPEAVSLNTPPDQFVVEGVRRGTSDARANALARAVTGHLFRAPDAAMIVRPLVGNEDLLGVLEWFAEPRTLAEARAEGKDTGFVKRVLALRAIGALLERRDYVRVQPEARRPAPTPEPSDAPASEVPRRVGAGVPPPPSTPSRPPPPAVVPPPRPRADRTRTQHRQANILGALDAVSSSVHYENGCRHLAEGALADAVAELEHAARLAPQEASYLEALGQALLLADESDGGARGAIEVLGRAVRIDPDRGDTHYYLGIALLRLGRVEPARQSLARAVSLGGLRRTESERLLGSLPRR